MKLIDREMQVKETITDNNNYLCCQASINSNGNIVLRNYDIQNKDSDEIIILSEKETEAIFELMKRIKKYDNALPF